MTEQRRPLLHANLRWFLLAMILANITGQMGYSMMSLYLVDLGADVGQVGLVLALASLVPTLLQILGGWLSDTMPTGSIQLPKAPAVQGLTFRHLRDEQDAAAVHALRGGCVETDQVDLLYTSEGLPRPQGDAGCGSRPHRRRAA